MGRHHNRSGYPNHPAPGGAHYEKNEHRENTAPRDDSRHGYPDRPAPGGVSTRRSGTSFRDKVKERLRRQFHEQDATHEEVEQIELNARREKARTSIKKAKNEGRSYGYFGNKGQSSRGYSRSSDSGFSMGSSLLDGGFGGGGMGGFGRGLDSMLGSGGMMSGKKSKKGGTGGFGSGLNDMFGI